MGLFEPEAGSILVLPMGSSPATPITYTLSHPSLTPITLQTPTVYPDLTESQPSEEKPVVEESLVADKQVVGKVYLKKLLRVSPRVHYGIGFYESAMTYTLPDLNVGLDAVKAELKPDLPWVPWEKIDLSPYNTTKERALRKHGQFFGRAGINLPLFFIDVEGGIGMFSESLVEAGDVVPVNEFFSEENLKDLIVRQVTSPRPKGALTARMGMELSRVLPDPWLPRVKFGPVAMGLDASGYYLFGTDMSYQAGLELIDPEAVTNLELLFDPIPLIPAKVKTEAAETIITRVESKLPAYFWPPALTGYGLSGKVYVDVGKSLRFSACYHYEKTKGISFESSEWLGQGPRVIRTFYSFGIESQL
ncbi:MAG: hypothetical protein SF052_10265 [Bacteroidia bacterium]|nr:hypothetical protein [Bacteroidia bacterium]